MGILGNEKADAAAKSAFSLPVTRMKLPATGMYPLITKIIRLVGPLDSLLALHVRATYKDAADIIRDEAFSL